MMLTFVIILLSCNTTTTKKKINGAEITLPPIPAKAGGDKQDTICSFHKISKSASVNLSQEFTDVNYTFLYDNILYLMGSGAKSILMMDTGTGEIRKSNKLNKLISSISVKLGFPGLLSITKDRIYVGFDKGIVCMDKEYKILYQIQVFYNNFVVKQSGQLIVFGDSYWSIYDAEGALIKKAARDTDVLHFYKSNDGFYCDDDLVLKKIDINADTLAKSEVGPTTRFAGFDPNNDYPAFITKDYIVWTNFAKRDKLTITDKTMKIVKVIPLKGVNWAMTKEELNDAAGNPTFFVDINGDSFFASVYKNNSLLVYKGCLGLKNH